MKLLYRFESTSLPVRSMRLKVEVNTREHFTVRGLRKQEFVVRSPWHEARAHVTTYDLEELLGTKLRALYQRKKGRDLHDLWLALSARRLDLEGVVECFQRYMEHSGLAVTRAMFEADLAEKLSSAVFRADVIPLLREGAAYDVDAAGRSVREQLISLLPGEPWRGLETA